MWPVEKELLLHVDWVVDRLKFERQVVGDVSVENKRLGEERGLCGDVRLGIRD